MGILSCVSVIAPSCAIDKVYLIIRLQNALWNCYFLSKLLFQSLDLLKLLTYILSQELLFKRMQFFRTANFQQLTSWSFYILKYLGGGRGARVVHRVKYYSGNLSIKYHDQNFYVKTAFSGQHWTEKTIDECEKSFILGEFNKNINFSTKFQYWIGWKTNNLRLAIPHCNIFF